MRISDWSSDVCSSDLLEWEKLAKSSGASSRDEILADIGLGKRLAAVVARRFAPENAILATTAAAVDEITSTANAPILRSEEHTSELQSLMRISYAVFCLQKKKHKTSYVNNRETHNKHDNQQQQ